MGKRILITGATGFVGSYMLEQLAETNHSVSAISHSANNINGIEQVFAWQEIENIEGPFDCVLHFAGLAHDTKNELVEQAYFDVNVGLTEKLLSQLDKWQTKKFVYLSSIKAMVDSFAEETINENYSCQPTHVYGKSKLAAEKVINDASIKANKYILRPVLIYGPGQKGNLQMLENLADWHIPSPLKKWQNKRSLLYIGNLWECINTIIEKPIDAGTYLIADDNAISTHQLIQFIAIGKKKGMLQLPIPKGLINWVYKISPNKIKQLLDKLLGSLSVDNSKLKKALHWNNMPYTTESGFAALYK